MKIIHCADLHLGSRMSSGLPADKAEVKKTEVRQAFGKMLAYAREHGVKAILLCGDVFDSDRPFKKDKEYFYNAVQGNADIDFYYLRGNHDTGESYTEELPNLKTFTPDGWTTYELGEGITVSGAEMTGGNASSLYAQLSLPREKTNIVMLHGTPGSSAGRDMVCLPRLRDKNIDYLALGHIHARSEGETGDRDRGGVYVMPGCLEGRGFDEPGEKGFYILDAGGGSISYEFVVNSLRVVRAADVDVSAADSVYSAVEIVREAVKCGKNDIVRVELTGETDFDGEGMEKDVLRMLDGKCWHSTVKDRTRRKIDYSAAEGDLSLRGEFMRLVAASDLTDDDMKRDVINAGLRALAGREVEL